MPYIPRARSCARFTLVAAVLHAVSFLAAAPAGGACDPDFLPRVDLGLLQLDAITEASGLAASRRNPGVLWTHNDSGDSSRIFALSAGGEHLGTYTIAGATNRDWEDIAVGPGPDPGVSYLYIGEIGDNSAVYETKIIYRLPEPPVDSAQAPVDTTLCGVEAIVYRYPDGRRDAETLMLDPWTRDLYVVSKREAAVSVYRAPYPQPVGPVATLEPVATLAMTLVVGGDISPGGREILIKTYTEAFLWCRAQDQTLADALASAPIRVPYTAEPQGEAIAWGADGSVYFTTSEEAAGVPARLYAYPRNPAGPAGEEIGPASGTRRDQQAGAGPAPSIVDGPATP